MEILMIKLGATGDVVRTTPLIERLDGTVTWLTDVRNTVLFRGATDNVRCFSWTDREKAIDRSYDLAINLEDTKETSEFLEQVHTGRIFGAHLNESNGVSYTDDSKGWFDLSIISRYGKEKADTLKFQNRRSYQEMIFEGLGFQYAGERYLLPEPRETRLSGDVAIASEAGPVWPMKKWAYYGELKRQLENNGLIVNVLPKRGSLLEHLADVRNHRCLVSGDSLPMHFALGSQIPCVSLFTCTSPWEIYDYGVQKKIISPLLGEFFYKRGYDERATKAITVDEVFDSVMSQLELSTVLTTNKHEDTRI
jgi:heptosyltransferase-2